MAEQKPKPDIAEMLDAISQDLLSKAKDGIGNYSAAVEATGLVYGERAKQYGHRTECFHRAARIMNAIKDQEDSNVYTGKKVALLMIAMKQARRQYRYTRDNNVDIIGYTDLLETLEREELGMPLTQNIFQVVGLNKVEEPVLNTNMNAAMARHAANAGSGTAAFTRNAKRLTPKSRKKQYKAAKKK